MVYMTYTVYCTSYSVQCNCKSYSLTLYTQRYKSLHIGPTVKLVLNGGPATQADPTV